MPAEILIVDDRPGNLQALEAVLAKLDRPVTRADSGEAALKILLEREVAVILLDVQMAGMDGFETAALIRARPRTREVPIIFVTAYDDDFRDARRAYDLGAFDYLTKPFDEEIVRQKVAAFVRLYEQSQLLTAALENMRLRDMFLAVLGHDLRNPLAAAQMATDALRRGRDLQSNLDRIARATSRMGRLIDDVLDFARGQLGGGIPLQRREVKLVDVVERIVEEVRGAHPEREILTTVSGDPHGSWDEARLEQVLSNLLVNAVNHSKEGAVRVAVSTADGHALLQVTNTGRVPADLAERLFRPFQRGNDARAGLGLGLYIVREIVSAHGGMISLQSDDETTFTVMLPLLAES